MEENKQTQLDAFLQKQLQEIPRETPSVNFTANIMNRIEQQESARISSYKPLISKPVWFVIAAAILTIIIVPLKNAKETWFDKISFDLSFLSELNVSGLFEGFTVPATAFYGLVLFTVMIFAQVLYVKGFFRPRASVL